jgi:hypothetical protein
MPSLSGLWLVFPFIGAIRLSTVLAFVATLVIVAWCRRSLLVALLTGMGWVSAFEIVYQAVGTIYGRHDALHLFYLTFSISGWVVAAHVAGVRPHPALILGWGLVFLGWMASGFQPNLFDQPDRFSYLQEVFNVLAKDGLAAVYVIGALAPFHLQARTRPLERSAPAAIPTAGKGDSVRT